MQTWIPNLRSWLSAIFLISVMAALQSASGYLWLIISWLIALLPSLESVLIVLALLSPIAVIAGLHHWLHRALDEFFPQSAIAEVATATGIFPGLISWWEGLYGWLVNYLALLISSAILSLLLPRADLHHLALSESVTDWISLVMQPQPILLAMIALRILIAAMFYHFEFAVRQRLISTGNR
jgi:hypothetical protein